MLSNWSDSPPLQPVVAETPAPASAASIVPPVVGGVTNPPRASSYVPPHLRNPRPSASLVPEAAQDAFRIHNSPAPLNGSKNHGRPSVLGAPPRAKPVAAAGSRAWPLTGSSPGEAVRWDTVAAEPSGGSNGRNAVNGRRGNSGNNGRNAVNDRRGNSGSNGRNAVNDRRGNSGSNGQTAINDRRGTSYRELDPFVKDEASEAIFSQENSGINFDAYEDIPVETSGKDVPPPVNTFGEIDLGGPLNVNIQRCKYVKPTPVQKHAIPISLAGRDLMACAQTGSGKTAAFCFPIIAGLLHSPPRGQPFRGRQAFPSALILSPTRELSCQIHDEAKKFAHQTGIKVVVAYGGTPIHHQLRELERGVDILVATPGRLSDLLERARISLSMVKYLALDEADRMLDMGFEPQIRKIVEQMDMPPVGQRQTMFFSATFPKEIQRLAADFLYNYIFLAVGRVGSSTDLINQKVEYVNDADKRSVLTDLIHAQNCKNFHSQQPLTLVFVETKRGADALEDWLCRMGFPATTIHGDRTQTEREHALRSFKTGMTPILVATDVAARGLDIPHVAHVVNFDLPNDIDGYVHRIGRTGRAGKTGLATAFFTDKDMFLAKSLVELMQESNQEVPDWLLTYATRVSYEGRGRSGRSGSGPRFGGRDYRKEGNKAGDNRSRGGHGGYGGFDDYGRGHGGSGNYGGGYGGSGGYTGGYGGSGGYTGGYGGSGDYIGGYGGSGDYTGGYGGSDGGDYGGSGGNSGGYGSSNGCGITSNPWV